MANRNRDAGREKLWRATLKRQAASGLSVRRFCRREELAESNFYAWRRTIARRDREKSPTRRARQKTGRDGKTGRQKTAPAFVPVTIHDPAKHDAAIVVERPDGLRLRFSESIEPDRLAAIVHALEGEAGA